MSRCTPRIVTRWRCAAAILTTLWLTGCHTLLGFGPPSPDTAGGAPPERGQAFERGSAPDLGAMEVSRRDGQGRDGLRAGDGCTGPLTAASTPVPQALLNAQSAYNAATTPFASGQVTDVLTFQVATCLGVRLAEVAELVYTELQSRIQFSDGTILSRLTLVNTSLFTTAYSSAGPALLAAVDQYGGAPANEGWYVSGAIPCHNCTLYQVTFVLFYPATGRVVRIDGTYGWDS